MLQILFSLLCLKYLFFWLYQSVRFEAKERVRTCKDYVIGREISTILKIAVDSITLGLRDSCDYFAYSQRKLIKFNRHFEKRESCCLQPWYRIVRIIHGQTLSQKKFQIKIITSSKISQQLRLVMQSVTRGKQFVCSRCQLMCYRLISRLSVYSHQ